METGREMVQCVIEGIVDAGAGFALRAPRIRKVTRIVIHVSPTLDAMLRGKTQAGQTTVLSRSFQKLLATCGGRPEPLFPNNPEASPERIWHLMCPDDKAKKLVKNLLSTPGVEGAYVKPPEGLAGPP
jgi:hypothetical protein